MNRQQPPRRIPLGRGRWAIVDAEDFERLIAYNWTAFKAGRRIYARRSVRATSTCPRKRIRMHRQILDFPEGQIDHANSDGLDNRRCNLRLATATQQCANRRLASNNVSGCKGVWFEKRKGRWRAAVQCQGHKRHCGYFIDIHDAARAYQAAANKFFGDFAHPAKAKSFAVPGVGARR